MSFNSYVTMDDIFGEVYSNQDTSWLGIRIVIERRLERRNSGRLTSGGMSQDVSWLGYASQNLSSLEFERNPYYIIWLVISCH